MNQVPSAGKRERTSHDWFWVYSLLVEKVARDFLANYKA